MFALRTMCLLTSKSSERLIRENVCGWLRTAILFGARVEVGLVRLGARVEVELVRLGARVEVELVRLAGDGESIRSVC